MVIGHWTVCCCGNGPMKILCFYTDKKKKKKCDWPLKRFVAVVRGHLKVFVKWQLKSLLLCCWVIEKFQLLWRLFIVKGPIDVKF